MLRRVTAILSVTLFVAWQASANALEDLASLDPGVRASTFGAVATDRALRREALEAAAASDDPALAESARRLLLGIDSGLAEIPVSQQSPGLAEAALTAHSIDFSTPASVRRLTRAVDRLMRQPAVAAPVLAALLERVLTDEQRVHRANRDVVLTRVNRLHAAFDRGGIDVRLRPALIGALLARSDGETTLRRWLAAGTVLGDSSATSHRLRMALLASDEGSEASRWVRGETESWPTDLPWQPSVDDRALTITAHAILHGRPVPAFDDTSSLVSSVIELATLLANPDADADALAETDAELTEIARVQSIPLAAALAGDVKEAERLSADNARGLLGLFWETYRFADYAEFQVPELESDLARQRNWHVARSLRAIRRGNTRIPPIPFELGIEAAFAATALQPEAELATLLTDVQRLDRSSLAWPVALEGVGAAIVSPARLPLDDPRARLRLAQYADTFDARGRQAALAESRNAVAWALLQSAEQANSEIVQLTASSAAVFATESGEYEEAVRLNAIALLLSARSDVRGALGTGAHVTWPRSDPIARAVSIRAAIHSSRALASDGDDAAVERERRRALSIAPVDTSFVIGRVRQLDAAGRETEATTLFAEALAEYQKLLANFESSPMLANQAAWMASRSGRRLDTAERYAGLATAGAPGTAAYLDTLAEVYAAQGDNERAMKTMRATLAASNREEFAIFVHRLAIMRREAKERQGD